MRRTTFTTNDPGNASRKGRGHRAALPLWQAITTKRSTVRPEARLSFATFLRSASYRSSRWRVIDEVTNRMAAANIKSRADLMRFVRENFPEAFGRYFYLNECTGKQATERLWADFLSWLHRRRLDWLDDDDNDNDGGRAA